MSSKYGSRLGGTRDKLDQVLGFLKQLTENQMGLIGIGLFIVTATPIVLAPLVAMHDPTATNYAATFQPPSLEYPFGTDNLGRSIWARVVHGGRISLMISLLGVSIAFTLGSSIGITAGYFGGLYDEIVMRLIDTSMAFPVYVLAMLLITIIDDPMVGVVVAIGFVFTPNFARISRGSTLSVKEEEFVDASKTLGFSDRYIMRSDILPNVIAPLLVQIAISAGYGIIVEAGLAFLGLGVGQASLGILLAEGRNFIAGAPWIIVLPGLYMTLIILSFNLIGDAVRDQLDPELTDDVEVKG